MTTGSRYLMIVSMLVLMIPLILLSCKNQAPIPVTEVISTQDTSKVNVQEIMLDNESQIEANINALMQLIKEKEAELQKAEDELSEKRAMLKEKEDQLAKIEHELKLFRTITYFILAIGLVLVITGLILIRSRKRAAKTVTHSDTSKSKT